MQPCLLQIIVCERLRPCSSLAHECRTEEPRCVRLFPSRLAPTAPPTSGAQPSPLRLLLCGSMLNRPSSAPVRLATLLLVQYLNRSPTLLVSGLEEVEENLELFKSTWHVLGITVTIQYTWYA
ncbi:unnamed protein product [Cuscuta europaea]|uniref:Uncharacterized protein n=1 Tax=Cuscuta europaea TaxID=41803 RepID=A0A9P0YHZ3_CUSEU|nr:unnamed protein product [Cuscuta europaea]